MTNALGRRAFIKGIAAAQLLRMLPKRLFAVAAGAGSRLWRRVRPSDSAWPSPEEWQKLAEEVDGHLIQVLPLLALTGDVKNLRNPFYLGEQPAGTQVSGWLDAWTPAESVYAVEARQASHVAAAINFARKHRLRLVVKGAGHSYQGTSNAPDSLLIWTRAMDAVTLHGAFIPTGDGGQQGAVPAVSAGAGAVWIDLYHAVTTEGGRYVQGGGCTDVGVAGLVQSGGFGSTSKAFGTAAANLLEVEIVTADGVVRTVSTHSEPELFWAIQGGGGGSWGVVTRLTLRTHEAPEFIGATWGTIRASSDEAFRRLIARFVDFYVEHLFNSTWGEEIFLEPDNTLKLSMVCQGLTLDEAKAVWRPFLDWVSESASDYRFVEKPGTSMWPTRSFWDPTRNSAMTSDLRSGAPAYHGWWKGDQGQVGAFLYGYDSVWLPAGLLESAERPRLVAAFFAASRHMKLQISFNKGLAGGASDAIARTRGTATNPAVCEAFALVIIADGKSPGPAGMAKPPADLTKPRQVARAVDAATAELKKIVPDAGSYVSESNYFNPGWQRAFWGDNYPRLRAVKAKYDPEGLFFVHHGVGTENWSADGFTKLS